MAPFFISCRLEKLHVFGIRSWPPSLNVIRSKLVKTMGYPQFVQT